MTIKAAGMADDQILEYTWTDLTGSWVLIRSSSLKKQEAKYTLTPAGNKTKVKFEITVDPVVPIPGFLLKRSVSGGAETATEGLKSSWPRTRRADAHRDSAASTHGLTSRDDECGATGRSQGDRTGGIGPGRTPP